MPVTGTVGSTTVIALEDGAGPFFRPRREAFPQATPEGSSWTPVPGRLPQELAAAAIDPADVSSVVLTHLHADHVGWAVLGEPGRPHFPNASYLIQRTETTAVEQGNPDLAHHLIAPLRSADQLRLVDGDVRLDDAVRLVATPGHTPGHQSVLVQSGNATVLLTGDLLVHAVQLIDPDVSCVYEDDPVLARASRVAMLDALGGGTTVTLGTPHLGEPFSRAPRWSSS